MPYLGPTIDWSVFPNNPYPGSGDDGGGRGRSTALEGSDSIFLGFDGLDIDALEGYTKDVQPYENLATDQDVADRALKFVRDQVRWYDEKTIRLQRKWNELNYLLQGQSLRWGAWEDQDHIHSPRLYQAVETLESRITDAVLNNSFGDDQWFAVRGREEMDRLQEDKIASYLDWVLEHNKFEDMVPELVRTMMVHAFCVVKTRWVNEVDWRVIRKRNRLFTKSGLRIQTSRKEEQVLVYTGPVIEMVDPYWFGCDTDKTRISDMTFIYDRSRMTLDEIRMLGEQGIYENVSELEGQMPLEMRETYSDWGREYRSLTYPYNDFGRQYQPPGAASEFIVDECWCRFDPEDRRHTREFVITIANGRTVLRVQENPHDDKHRPYAYARACKYPFDFHSVSPLDHAIQLSIEIDIHRQLTVEGSRLSVAPFVFADQRADLGENLWQHEPGKVFEIPPGSVQFAEINSPAPNMRYMENILREDIQETTGAVALHMGSGGDHQISATEFSGRQQEANKRIRSYIRSFSRMCSDMLGQLYSLSGQYMTQARGFRVIGRQAVGLRAWEEIDPEIFDTSVDFTFTALGNQHIAGMEATNLQLYLNTAAPFIQANPGVVNVPLLLQRFGKLLLGTRSEGIVHVPDDPRNMVPQDVELEMMLRGQPLPVHEMDDDEEHMVFLEGFFGTGRWQDLEEDVKGILRDHYYAHVDASNRKTSMSRAQDSYQPPFIGGQLPYAGQGSMTNLQRQNDAQTTGQPPSAAQAPPGEALGPPNAMQVAAPGRATPFFQGPSEGLAG